MGAEELTSFGLIKDGWLYDTAEGTRLLLGMWDESGLDVQALVLYTQSLERRIRNLDGNCRALEQRIHKLEGAN